MNKGICMLNDDGLYIDMVMVLFFIHDKMCLRTGCYLNIVLNNYYHINKQLIFYICNSTV